MADEMLRRLREFSIIEIKKIVRRHNLHSVVKLQQKKEALIDGIMKHYESTGDGSVIKSSHLRESNIKLDDYTPTKDVITVRKYKEGATSSAGAEPPTPTPPPRDYVKDKNKRADDLIKVLNTIKANKSATDKIVSDAKKEIERLREAKALRKKKPEAKTKDDKAKGIAELIKSLNKIKSNKKATESVVARAKMEIADLKETALRYGKYTRCGKRYEPVSESESESESESGSESESLSESELLERYGSGTGSGNESESEGETVEVEVDVQEVTTPRWGRFLADVKTGDVYDVVTEKEKKGYKWNFKTKEMTSPRFPEWDYQNITFEKLVKMDNDRFGIRR